jgi:hypothetical protein
MIADREILYPPPLTSVQPLLAIIPAELHSWIAEKHIQYLDDRIHKIDRLTDYLANCQYVEQERNEFVTFVLDWTRREAPDLECYLREYQKRFSGVRMNVEKLCVEFLDRVGRVSLDADFLDFWAQFAKINELDSVHGMFLTSGRWYVNVMLPAVKELVYCFLASYETIPETTRNELAYHVTRRVITPRFAETPESYNHAYERRFATLFMPVLQHFDRKLCFLFELFSQIPESHFTSSAEFVTDVKIKPEKYNSLLSQGIYPPFGWHELNASRKTRRPGKSLSEASINLLQVIPGDFHERALTAIDCLSILKEYELNYNNYNYKGRFGLISKYQYWVTSKLLSESSSKLFMDAILLDRFFDAFAILEHSTDQQH